MLKKVQTEKILFLDIETAPLIYNYNEMDSEGKRFTR